MYVFLLAVVLVVWLGGLTVLLVGASIHGYFMIRNRVPYVTLPDGAMQAVIEALGVRDSDIVYDLGCGDGRVLLALHEANPHAKYVGVENDWIVWLRAKWRLRSKSRLVRGEISTTPLSEATRVFCYLGKNMMAELEPRFERELPKGGRVVSVQFPLPNRAAVQSIDLSASKNHANKLYIYDY